MKIGVHNEESVVHLSRGTSKLIKSGVNCFDVIPFHRRELKRKMIYNLQATVNII